MLTIFCRRITELVAQLQVGRPRTLKLTIVRQRDKLEIVFKVCHGFKFKYHQLSARSNVTLLLQHFLCEDRSAASDSNFSYVDFLCHMHKEIRAMLN